MESFPRRRWAGFLASMLCCMACALPTAGSAAGLDSLESFVRTVRAGHAEFTQTVTSPGRDGQVARTKNSAGSFDFSRPNRFRFIYRKPMAQTIVADGQILWLYDEDLNQVTARKQAAVLASTPAALIASAPDTKSLQADFVLTDVSTKDAQAHGNDPAMEWVLAMPKASDSSLHSIRVGFKNHNLAALDILDSFGQRSQIFFGAMQTATPPEASAFQFKPPAGADVIHQ